MTITSIVELSEPDQNQTKTEAELITRPLSIWHAVSAFKQAMFDIEAALVHRSTASTQLQARVDAACETLKHALRWLVRETPHLKRSFGTYVFQQTRGFFNASRFLRRCLAKPRGQSRDYGTLNIIYDQAIEGQGRLGPLLDRWALGLGVCHAVRSRRQAIVAPADRLLAEWAHQVPMPICSLASGPPREIFDLLGRADPAPVQVTCVEVDREALAFSEELARQKRVGNRINFAFESIDGLAAGTGTTAVRPQQFIYSTGLTDYLPDQSVINLLGWIHDHLRPGGIAAIGSLSWANPDKEFMHYMANWSFVHRSPDELRALFARSKFGFSPVEVWTDTTGLQLLALCRSVSSRNQKRSPWAS
jgi:extracellular factor (EF) 3-hydroxypalmitic acid methyl ester biosynthesis protein